MQLVHRVIRLQASRSFHGSSRCAKQELFEEWQRPLNKTQLKTIYKAQARKNPKYNGRFQQDATALLRKAYSRTIEERHSDSATLQQLRNIIQERAGDRFDIVDISTHTYALPLRSQPAEFLIVDSQYPNGRDVPDEYSIMYDANAFTALLAEHGFKCFGQRMSKKWPDTNVFVISEREEGRESTEGYEAPVTLHVGHSGGRPMEMDGPQLPISSMIPSISFSVTLPHPAVLPLNRLLGTYFRLAPEIRQAWALLLLWVRSLGLGTSTPGMRSVDDTLDIVQSRQRRNVASQSLPYPYVEELSPTCLALLLLVHLVEAKRLPNLFDVEDRHVVGHQKSEPQHIWVPHTYHSSSHHPTHGQRQATRYQCRQSCDTETLIVTRRTIVDPQRNRVQTSTQIETAFGHFTSFTFQFKVPKIINSFFEYLSTCAESRYDYYSLRKGAKVPRDMPSSSQFRRRRKSATQIEQTEPAKHVPERPPQFWKLDRLVVQDPFISTHNHAAFVSSVTLHRITQSAKMARRWVIRGHPLWTMFGPHLKSTTVSSTFQHPRNATDTRTGTCEEYNCQSLKKSNVTVMGGSFTGAPEPIRASPPHIRDSVSDGSPGLWGGLIDIQRQAAERTRIESENIRLLENERIQAKSNNGEQVAGKSSGSTRFKPARHRAGQFSRGVHTTAAPPLTNDKAVEIPYKPKNVNHPRIGIGFPSIDNTNTRERLISKVRNVIKDSYGPRYGVRPYGSSVYMVGHGLSTTNNGDLDLVVLDSKWPQGFTPAMDMEHLPLIYDTRKLARVMRYAGFTAVESIPWARVPIVKFTDPVSGLNVDINVNERLGLLNTDLVKAYCDVIPGLRCLVSAIKKWARPRNLNHPSADGGLQTFSSYALVLMTIAWLQTRGLAPKLQVGLQPMEADQDLFWMRPTNPSKRIPCDTRYHKTTTWVAPPMGTGLDNVIEQWFRFWAGFQFSRHVIDIKRGGIYPRIPHFDGAAYRDEVRRGPRSETRNNWSAFLGPDVDSTTTLDSYAISVVDPFIRSRNVTRGINAQALKLFQAECESAAELLMLGIDMTDVIDGFDLLKQDFNSYQKGELQHVDHPTGNHAESPREIRAPKLADPRKSDAIHHWNTPGSDNSLETSNHSTRDGLSVGRISLSDAPESSRVADGTIASPPRDAPLRGEQVRDDEEEGFGLKRSYFKKNGHI